MSETASVQDSPPKRLRGVAATARPGRRLGGRAKGTGNKIDGDIKKMVITALHYAGGVDYLVKQAHRHPVAFMGLVGRVLPLQVTGANGGPLAITIGIDRPPEINESREEWIARRKAELVQLDVPAVTDER